MRIGFTGAAGMRSGWIVGGAAFCDQVAQRGVETLGKHATCEVARKARRLQAEQCLLLAREHLGWNLEEVLRGRKMNWRKAMLAAWVRSRCAVSNQWITTRLQMGHLSNISRSSNQLVKSHDRRIKAAQHKLHRLGKMLKSST